jgi:hypothetical protein
MESNLLYRELKKLVMKKKEQPIRGYRKVAAFIEKLINSPISMEEAEEWAEEFFYTVEEENIDLIPALLQLIKDTDQNPDVVTTVAFLLEQYGNPGVLEPLRELFKSPGIRDTTRSILLGVMDYYGIDLQDPTLISYFQDIKGLGQAALEGMLQLSEREEMLETLLEEASNFSPEAQLRMIQELGKSRDERAIPILGIFAEYQDKELAEAAIMQLGSIRSGKSIETLENLINHQQDSRELIERSLRKLQFAGVTKAPSTQESSPIYKCLLSWIDGRGSRIMVIARQKDIHHAKLAQFMLHEKAGIKDCYGALNIPLKDVDKMAKKLKKQVGGIEVEYGYCLQLVRDALWTALKNEVKISPLFSFYRKIFENDTLTPQAYKVDLTSHGLEEARRSLEELLATSHELISKPPFSDWWPDTPPSYDFVQKKKRSMRNRILDSKILQEFLTQILEPDRKHLIKRLELTIDFLAKKNPKAYEIQIRKALALWIALKEQNQPLENIPFMKELAALTLKNVLDNIRMGYTEPVDYVPEY